MKGREGVLNKLIANNRSITRIIAELIVEEKDLKVRLPEMPSF